MIYSTVLLQFTLSAWGWYVRFGSLVYPFAPSDALMVKSVTNLTRHLVMITTILFNHSNSLIAFRYHCSWQQFMPCRHIVNRTLKNKLQWNYDQNSYISIQENIFENVVSEMVSILPRPPCVDMGPALNFHNVDDNIYREQSKHLLKVLYHYRLLTIL